jgi:hypothetical protein
MMVGATADYQETGPAQVTFNFALEVGQKVTFQTTSPITAGFSGVVNIRVDGLPSQYLDGLILLKGQSHVQLSMTPGLTQIEFGLTTTVADRRYRVNLSSQIGGGNTVFTFPEPFFLDTEEVFVDGILRQSGAGEDYTILTSTQIQFNYVLQTNQKIWVSYNPVL